MTKAIPREPKIKNVRYLSMPDIFISRDSNIYLLLQLNCLYQFQMLIINMHFHGNRAIAFFALNNDEFIIL